MPNTQMLYYILTSLPIYTRAILIGSQLISFYYTFTPNEIFRILKNTNIHPSFAPRLLSYLPFLTEEHPLGFKETGRWFKRNGPLV